jgi:hypothetical protein
LHFPALLRPVRRRWRRRRPGLASQTLRLARTATMPSLPVE